MLSIYEEETEQSCKRRVSIFENVRKEKPTNVNSVASISHSKFFNAALAVHGRLQKSEWIRIKMYFHIHVLCQQNWERPLLLPSSQNDSVAFHRMSRLCSVG